MSASAAFAAVALAGSALWTPASAMSAQQERSREAAAQEKRDTRSAKDESRTKSRAEKLSAQDEGEQEGAKKHPAVLFEDTELSADALRVAEWIATSDDNSSLPYMIIDKKSASLFLFDGEGELVGHTPVLIGVAEGDEATAGVGAKKLSEIGPAERTTPAGRFAAKYGLAVGNQRVLWVDYATSVALHAVITGNKKEKRLERLLSPDAEDNRITFGCINVPTTFYKKDLSPLFRTKDGGIVYVLPDSRPIEEVFPRLRVQPFVKSGVLSPDAEAAPTSAAIDRQSPAVDDGRGA